MRCRRVIHDAVLFPSQAGAGAGAVVAAISYEVVEVPQQLRHADDRGHHDSDMKAGVEALQYGLEVSWSCIAGW